MSWEPMPSAYRAFAVQLRCVDPDREWDRFLHTLGGRLPEKNAQERWSKWLRTAKKKPEANPESESTTAKPWQEPNDWREAKEAAERGDVDNAAECRKIFDALNAIPGGTPMSFDEVATTFAPCVDPICARCGRLANATTSTTCGRDDCAEWARKKSGDAGAPARTKTTSEPSDGDREDAGELFSCESGATP